MHYQMDLSNVLLEKFYPISGKIPEISLSGEEIGFANYYMIKNGHLFRGNFADSADKAAGQNPR